MGLFTKLRQQRRAGKRYEGPAAWCDDYTAVPRPGFYALTPDGKNILADVPLVCIDEAPGDPDDGSCHYVYAGPHDYPQRSADGTPIRRGDTVPLEVDAEGQTGVNA